MKLYAVYFNEYNENCYVRVFKTEEAREQAITKYINDSVFCLLKEGYPEEEIIVGVESVYVSGSDIFYDYEELDCVLEV